MARTVISVENLSKYYRLGVIGGATLREDLSRWWARMRNKPDPYATIGQENTGNERGEIWALRDINLEIKEGEILGVIGRNGAGKSTLLKVLSRITAPTSGRAVIRGRVGSLLEVGTGFHPELTGRENIFLNGAILGMTKAEVSRKLDEIVEFAEMSNFIDTPVKRYSSGMTVRLAFAVAAHLEPEILIIDEVLAVGDAAFQKKCLGKMGEVASKGRTILFVSHNMESVQRLCNRGILLAKGQVEQMGSVNDLVAIYLRSATVDCGNGSFVRTAEHTRQSLDKSTISGIRLRHCDRGESTSFDVWDPIEIDFLIRHPSEEPIHDESIAAWFCINNSFGSPVLSFFQYDSEASTTRRMGDWPSIITARINALELPPGQYSISCGLFSFDELGKREIVDWAENIAGLEVGWRVADGRTFDQRIGYVISRCEWRIAA
ncbi:MAG: ATP-binding cassette domain-containing protein [Gammaproteobacteria bacterium]|nr:ATP-binding cassette domain-containing protein [Gammaproteobacteria bacterium]